MGEQTETEVLDDPAARYAAAFAAANQLMNLARYPEADDALGAAVAAAAAGARDEDLVAAAVVRSSMRYWHLGDAPAARTALDEAAALVRSDAALDALEAQRSVSLLFGGCTVEGLAVARRVRTAGRASEHARLLAVGMEIGALGLLGDVEALATLPAPPRPAPGTTGKDPVRQFADSSVHLAIGLARVINGLDAATDDRPPAAAAPTRAAMAGASEGTADVVEGMRLVWAGRPCAAGVVLERAVRHLRSSDRARALAMALGQTAYVRALLGDAAGAAAAADDAAHARHAASHLHDFTCGQGRAWAAAAAGELSAARETMAATATRCRELEQPVLAAQAWYDVARLGDPAAAARPLRRLALRSADGSLVRMLAAHVDALAAGDAAGVAAAAREARRWGHRLHAAEAAAQAAALYARGSGAEAEHWRATAHDLVAACEGARTPALVHLLDLDLTAREREIVGLVSRGMSNREVADRLHLSVRTVGNHLQAAYAKLGVHKREELAGLLPFG